MNLSYSRSTLGKNQEEAVSFFLFKGDIPHTDTHTHARAHTHTHTHICLIIVFTAASQRKEWKDRREEMRRGEERKREEEMRGGKEKR